MIFACLVLHVLPSSYPDASSPVQPESAGGGPDGSTFYTLGSVPLINLPLMTEYADHGVKTIAAVSVQDYAGTYNYNRSFTFTLTL